ncbi:MAG TPA: GEVED domain-containing protein [Methylomirabilota bacterium]|nr:GEVED domain-containing protein [Methylomirabilota bacterium]
MAGLGSSNDVVRVNLGRVEGWRADVASFENPGTLTLTTRGTIGGQSNQPLNSIRFERAGSNTVVSANFSGLGASQYRAEIYDRHGILLASRAPLGSGSSMFMRPCSDDAGNTGFQICWVAVFADSIYYVVCGDCITFDGGPGPIEGPITVKLSAVGATVRADYLSAVEIDGAAGTALTLANEAIQRGGHWHQFLGDAVLEAWPDDWEMPWFRVGNIGASGQDGLLTELGGAGALDVTLDPVDLNAAGRRLRIVATGRAGGVSGALAAVELVGSGQGSQLTVDLGALAGGYQLDAWDEARRTAGDLPQSSGSVMTLSPDANGAVRLEYFAVSKDSPDRLVVELEFAQTLTVTPVGFPAFRAKTVRITSVGPIESLGSVLQKWSGIGVVGVFFWGRDYGDAPEGYPVLLAEDGARHRRWPNWRLGANWDRDFVVAHSANADWDDLHNSFGLATATDDEDGVVFLATLGGILVQVTAAHDGYLNAWMDFNRDTDWADAGEHIIIDAALTAGVPRNFTITVPGGTTAGQFVSRWRLSETTGLSYTGYGGKGEVEDHVCQWEPEGPQYDFGDAPDAYQTLLASDGARHLVTAGWMIGTVIDAEADGLPAADADGDDLDGSDDEEGVNFTTGITPGAMATVEVSVTVPAGSTGYLNAWMDFGHNGTFADLDDHIIIDVPVMGGTYLVTANFPVPTTALPGFSYARFRLGPTAGLSYSGDGGAGEVEDYGFECDKLDFGDAPDSYRTTSAVDGARHVLFPQFCLGAVEDVESDGVPGASATGDDTSMPLGFDDEDGLSAATSLIPGSPATFDVYATIPGGTTGYLDAWADWNQDGDFDDANEQIAASHPLMNMLNIVGFNVPADALTGFTYVRLRLSSYGGLPSFGLASNGEVEDYRIEVVAAPGGVDLVVADPAPVEVIETGYFTSTITVSNKGPAAATSVRLISAIPAGVNVTSVSNSAGACQVQGSNIVCTVSSLPAQQSFSVTLTASPSPLPDDLASEFTDWSDWWWLADSSVEPESNPTDNRTRLAGVVFVRRDFGDAPHPSYATCLPGGARHRVVAGGGYCLGLLIDHEADCQPDDNLFNLADEDGVTFAPAPPWLPGTVVTPTVVVTRPAGTAARLDAWFDADGVAGFHPADRIYTGLLLLVIGPNVLPPFTVPATAPTGGTWLRFRLSQAGVAGPGGYAPNGEVEDYSVNILAPPVKFAGLLHSPLGGATLSASSNGLLVSNLGASGQDGVSIALQELSRAVTLGFGPAGLALPGGASRLSFSAVGMVNDVPERSLGKVSLQRHNGMMELAFDPATRPSVAMLRAEVYHQGALVGTAPVPPGGVLGTLVGDAALVGVVLREAPPGNTTEFIWWDFDFLAPVRFQSAGSAGSFTGNRIRLVGVNADGGVLQNLARLEVTGVNLASLLIREVSAPWFQPRLRIAPIGQRLQLNLDTRTAVLQQAPTANGPWSDVVEGTNVIVIGNTDARRFFRARIPERVLELSAAAACDFGFLSLNYVCKRNILLLIADDVGIDQIPWYTNHHASTFPITISSTTPNPSVSLPTLDKLAASGVTFVNAWSSPLCSPTRACLYTGQRSWRHGVFNALGTSGGLPVGTKTIANVLRDEGYANGLFGKWHCGEDTTLYTDPLGPPHEFGWDDHAGALGGGLGSYDPPYWNSTAVYRKVVNGTAVAAAEYATTENVNDALTWIGARTGPWMATVAFNAAHSPWASPPAGCEYQARSAANNRAYYRSMLECLDRSIAELLAGIDPDVLENTTVIFVGDNGTDESITEHFAAIRYGGTSHAKGSLYEGGINVPLVIADGYTFLHGQESPWTKGRGRVVSPGRIETSIVQTMDLFATAADIGRGDKSSGPDSVSLLPYLQSATAPAQRSYMSVGIRPDGWAFGDPGWDVAYRGECYKLIIRDLLSSSGETYELYDLTADRWESNDLNDGSLTLAEAYALLLDCP